MQQPKALNLDEEGEGVVEEGVGQVGHGVGDKGENPPGVREQGRQFPSVGCRPHSFNGGEHEHALGYLGSLVLLQQVHQVQDHVAAWMNEILYKL